MATNEKNNDNSKLTVNGVTFDFDVLDADVFEKFQKLNAEVSEKSTAVEEDEEMSEAEKMRQLCRIVDGFFDDMFGAGSSDKIFGGKNNHLGKHMEAYAKMVEVARKAPESINEITRQYSPVRLQNRAQRRAEQFKKAPQPGKQQHYDNYRDMPVQKAHGPVNASDEADTETLGDGDELSDVIAENGLTQEQFEKAIQIAARMKGDDEQ